MLQLYSFVSYLILHAETKIWWKKKCKTARKRCNSSCSHRCLLFNQIHYAYWKAIKDNYPNKLTDWPETDWELSFLCSGGKTKQKQKQKQNKSSTVSILCLETEAVNPWRSTKSPDPLLAVLLVHLLWCLPGTLFVFNDTYNGLLIPRFWGWCQTPLSHLGSCCVY